MAKDKLIQIKDRISSMEKIDWQNMLSIRNDDLKQHTDAQLEKLEQSLIHNGFIEPFAAWQDPKTKEIYTINGHTRKKRLLALIEKGYSIPEKLSAFFIDCKNLNDAASVLPLYESKYGEIDSTKLKEFAITFDLNETNLIGTTLDFTDQEIINADNYFEDITFEQHQKSILKQEAKQFEIKLIYNVEQYLKLKSKINNFKGKIEDTIYNLMLSTYGN